MILSALLTSHSLSFAAEATLPLKNGIELSLTVFPATRAQEQARILWIPSEHGLQEKERQLAKNLSKTLSGSGFSIWLPDFFNSWFIPATSENLMRVGSRPIVELIQHFRTHDNLPLIVITADKGAVNTLRALHELQQQATEQHQPFLGVAVILLNPNLNVRTPAPGEMARYWPVTRATNLPVFIIQAAHSPWRWSLRRLVSTLEHSGSDVFFQILSGVRDRFYFRPDAKVEEDTAAAHLPAQLVQAIKLLAPYMAISRQAAPLQPAAAPMKKTGNTMPTEEKLPIYRGKQSLALSLRDLSNQRHRLKDYRGRVVLLNFWASWCPPCIHEIPSMVRLKQKLGEQPFEILATNLGEEPATIQSFLTRHPVNFPVLLDAHSSAVKAWGVSAYPTSFLIDKRGKVRFALFGGYEWDNPAAMRQIQVLLDE